MTRYVFKRILFTALLLAAAFTAAAKDMFSGRTYRATKFLLQGMDLMPFINIDGKSYIQLSFNDDGTFVLDSSLQNIDLFADGVDKEGTYEVNRRQQTITLSMQGDDVSASYTDGGNIITIEEDYDSENVSLEFTAIELIPAREASEVSIESLEDSSGNRKVSARTFIGRSYASSYIFVDGTEYSSIFSMMGMEISSLLQFNFIDEKTVHLFSESGAMMGGEENLLDNDVEYWVDTANQSITFSNPDEAGELVLYYYGGGSRLKVIQPNDEGVETVIYFDQRK